MPQIDPAIKAAIFEEFVKGPERPTVASLAEKYKVGKRTIDRWVEEGAWVAEKETYWRSMAIRVANAAAEQSERYKEAGGDDRVKAIDELRWRLQMTKNLSVGAAQGLVPTERMSKAEVEALMLEWRQLPMLERAALVNKLNRTSIEIVKALELLEGHPTDRMEILSSPAWIELKQALVVVLKAHPDALVDVKGVLQEYANGDGE